MEFGEIIGGVLLYLAGASGDEYLKGPVLSQSLPGYEVTNCSSHCEKGLVLTMPLIGTKYRRTTIGILFLG